MYLHVSTCIYYLLYYIILQTNTNYMYHHVSTCTHTISSGRGLVSWRWTGPAWWVGNSWKLHTRMDEKAKSSIPTCKHDQLPSCGCIIFFPHGHEHHCCIMLHQWQSWVSTTESNQSTCKEHVHSCYSLWYILISFSLFYIVLWCFMFLCLPSFSNNRYTTGREDPWRRAWRCMKMHEDAACLNGKHMRWIEMVEWPLCACKCAFSNFDMFLDVSWCF